MTPPHEMPADLTSAAQGPSHEWDPILVKLGHGQWLWEPELARWQLSPLCAQLLGFGHAALTLDTESWRACFHPDDRDCMSACITQHDEHPDGVAQCTVRLAVSSENECWLLVRAVRVASAVGGAAWHVLGTCTEISSVPPTAHSSDALDLRLSAALEQAQIAWFERDLITNVLTGSPSMAVIYGLESLTGPWHYDQTCARITPEDKARQQREVELSLREKITHQTTQMMRYRIRRPDGEMRDLEVRYRVLYKNGRGRIFGLVFDVTTTKALESKFQGAMEHARMAWFERDLASDEIRGSRSLWQIYGFSPAQQPLHFSDVFSRIHPDDRVDYPIATEQLRARSRALNGTPLETAPAVMAYRVQPTAHEEYWLEVRYRVQLDGQGGGTVSGLTVDVTATKHAEAALREADIRLRLALDAAKMASWQWNFDDDTVHSLDGLGQYLHLPGTSPWPVSSIFDAIHPEDCWVVREQVEAARRNAGAQDLRLEYRVLRAEGRGRWIEVLARCNPQGMYGIVVDVTARKHAELERDRLFKQLQQAQKMEAIGLLTGGIAHDFNNILASVLGYSSLALQRFGDRIPDKLVDYLEEVQIAGGRARDLVAQMLAFSRGETGELEATDINLIVAQTVQMLRPTLPASIEIRYASTIAPPLVVVDAVQLQQVILNLCINARDATAGTGSIELTLTQRPVVDGFCASCHREFSGEYIVIGVCDDGPGLPEAIQIRMFEPFFSTKASGHGTGMGLAMVHGIVHRHEGHVLLSTAPDQGCQFEILLPAQNPSRVNSNARTTIDIASYPAPVPTAVLVVDDERAVASLVGELLALNGYTVTVETDAENAWQLFAAEPQRFDLLVTDQTMPRLSGAQLATRLKGLRRDLPVVMMTGYSATIDEHKARELGIATYLRKPVNGDELLAAVATAVQRAATAKT